MNDISFEIDYVYTALKEGLAAEKKIKESIFGFGEVSQKTENEFSLFCEDGRNAVKKMQAQISHVQELIRAVEGKAASAKASKRTESPAPEAPKISENASFIEAVTAIVSYREKAEMTEEENMRVREMNGKIDAYTEKCDIAVKKLIDVLEILRRIEAGIKKAIEATVTPVHEFIARKNVAISGFSKVSAAMSEFNYVFDKVYRDAEAIYNMKPVDIRGYSYIDRQFEVRNRRATASHVDGVDFRPYSAVTENGKKALGKQNVIREKEASAFFDVINGSQRIKMPSANLHRLGGKSFISKMNDMGYTMSAHADGSFVDADGMIVWEKDDG